MPISGLIITLEEDPLRRDAALTWLRRRPELELGVMQGRRLAAVSDTANGDEDKQLWESLRNQDGVQHVDVVFIHFDDDGTPVEPAAPLGCGEGRPS